MKDSRRIGMEQPEETRFFEQHGKIFKDMKPTVEIVKETFRAPPEKLYIAEIFIPGRCPAFTEWLSRTRSGEQLPRGRFFSFCRKAGLSW